MTAMRIVLDTTVLFDRAALLALDPDVRPKVLPAIAFGERARQRARDHSEAPETLRRWLELRGITIEAHGADEASRVVPHLHDNRLWRRHARDAMIAGHVRENDEFWTHNARDFLVVGLDADRIVDLTAVARG